MGVSGLLSQSRGIGSWRDADTSPWQSLPMASALAATPPSSGGTVGQLNHRTHSTHHWQLATAPAYYHSAQSSSVGVGGGYGSSQSHLSASTSQPLQQQLTHYSHAYDPSLPHPLSLSSSTSTSSGAFGSFVVNRHQLAATSASPYYDNTSRALYGHGYEPSIPVRPPSSYAIGLMRSDADRQIALMRSSSSSSSSLQAGY